MNRFFYILALVLVAASLHAKPAAAQFNVSCQQLPALTGAVTSTAGSCNTTILHTVNLTSMGAKCDGETDDTTAIQAWFNSAANNTALVAPAGICLFSSALTVPTNGVTSLTIQGAGRGSTIFIYDGVSTTNDLITFGTANGYSTGITVQGFSVMSYTEMTGGFALHFKTFFYSKISDVGAGVSPYPSTMTGPYAEYAGFLYGGVWFDGFTGVEYTHFFVDGSGDGILFNGTSFDASADIYLSNGFVVGGWACETDTPDTHVGIHGGGGAYAAYLGHVDVICKGYALTDDTSVYNADDNHDYFIDPATTFDSSTYDNIVLDNPYGRIFSFHGWSGNAGNATSSPPTDTSAKGLNIEHWGDAETQAALGVHPAVDIAGAAIFFNAGDGIYIATPTYYSPWINIDSATTITLNGTNGSNPGYGINAQSSYSNVCAPVNPQTNTSGAFHNIVNQCAFSTVSIQEPSSTVSSCTGTVTLNLQTATDFVCTSTGNVTLAISNYAASGFQSSLTLNIYNGGAHSWSWVSGTIWPDGTPPTLTTSGKDVIVCKEDDGTPTWNCFVAGQNLH